MVIPSTTATIIMSLVNILAMRYDVTVFGDVVFYIIIHPLSLTAYLVQGREQAGTYPS